ncbi:MAG: carbohydrate-binding family 9-like protein [Flavihumibacter sp.]|nr:carbohydrate-binding family 9-like protein [Flavihumibacter sp.]
MKKITIYRLLAICLCFVCTVPVAAQKAEYLPDGVTEGKLKPLLTTPPQYRAVKTNQPIQVDGFANEAIWQQIPFTSNFRDIAGGPTGNKSALKLCWDEQYLYVFAQLEQPQLWASLTKKDTAVFMDNALEFFIDMDGDMQQYIEFQINAFGTTWDLLLSKAYRDGGNGDSGFEFPGLKKAVRLRGTLNQPGDIDEGWDVELAIPLAPRKGQIARMNFSHVNWKLDVVNGVYQKQKDASGRIAQPHYIVWSPQGRVDLHMPERWGYILFSEEHGPASFISAETLEMQRSLWKYYYLQRDHREQHKRYASGMDELRKKYPGLNWKDAMQVQLLKDPTGFVLVGKERKSGIEWRLDAEGRLQQIKNR